MNKQFKVIILGGGSGGISTASRLVKAGIKNIAIIEHSDYHAYQPAWPLAGSGAEKKEDSRKKMKKIIPSGVKWIKQKVTGIQAPERIIRLDNGEQVNYEYLVVALGLQLDFNKIDGLTDTLGKHEVCTNYLYDYVDYTYQTLKKVKSGNVIVTKPSTPIKGGVAPENSLFTFDEFFKKNKKNRPTLYLKTAKDLLFPVEKYRKQISKLINKKGIQYDLSHDLIAVDGPHKKATFKNLITGDTYDMSFDMLLVTPPMSAPDVIKQSSLSDADGWLDINKHTLQHIRHQNIFGIGDCTNLPTVKMGAAVRKQVPVLADNLVAQIKGKSLTACYDGMTACPIATEYGQAIMAEFGYDMKPKESLPIDQSKTNPILYYLKKRAIPFMYWHGMLKGHS
ncbi:NAD(P)/FAD-dependent oxidoreductase [Macrococcus hajekii]|uniref:NAD(P)/FAD-dependent oxidoreductase n=1 Tax=Macrococcus hajekii TaxID=198482 RepID=A0A4R6BJW3_9STAP|nr:FAD/NAD(P)-binding oxidoreductase [Macrococcus hajekii]TDM01920.1 NAD(P)/FAD-dependent oxidoreductase [Macrococcus hajekii]GGB08560.1 pyridine nucleotide-disulfide oxidoreductase [Macrococcus hajekii]